MKSTYAKCTISKNKNNDYNITKIEKGLNNSMTKQAMVTNTTSVLEENMLSMLCVC